MEAPFGDHAPGSPCGPDCGIPLRWTDWDLWHIALFCSLKCVSVPFRNFSSVSLPRTFFYLLLSERPYTHRLLVFVDQNLGKLRNFHLIDLLSLANSIVPRLDQMCPRLDRILTECHTRHSCGSFMRTENSRKCICAFRVFGFSVDQSVDCQILTSVNHSEVNSS